jgi:hypothetical protein
MVLNTFDLRLLKIFATIVEAGSFAAAQGELNLSLSTISTWRVLQHNPSDSGPPPLNPVRLENRGLKVVAASVQSRANR